MPRYVFRIRQGTDSSDVPVDLADHDAAWHEGAKVCSELIRDVVARLRDSPEWRLEVRDETDEPPSSVPVDRRDFQEGVRPPQLAASFISSLGIALAARGPMVHSNLAVAMDR